MKKSHFIFILSIAVSGIGLAVTKSWNYLLVAIVLSTYGLYLVGIESKQKKKKPAFHPATSANKDASKKFFKHPSKQSNEFDELINKEAVLAYMNDEISISELNLKYCNRKTGLTSYKILLTTLKKMFHDNEVILKSPKPQRGGKIFVRTNDGRVAIDYINNQKTLLEAALALKQKNVNSYTYTTLLSTLKKMWHNNELGLKN